MEANQKKEYIRKIKQCQFCGTLIPQPSHARHEAVCDKNLSKQVKEFRCSKCSAALSRADALKRHEDKCQAACQKKKTVCSFPDCDLLFFHKKDVLEHIKIHHQSGIAETQCKEFDNFKDFLDWKEKEEHMSFSHFSQKTGTFSQSGVSVTYYYCQKDGPDVNGDRTTSRKNTKGQVKTGLYCTASIKVQNLESGKVLVWYNSTHTHELDPKDIQHHPISKSTLNFIDRQIALDQTPLGIQRQVRDQASLIEEETGKPHKECYVGIRSIRERVRRAKNAKQFHKDDATSVMLLTEKLKLDDPDLVLIYKPLGKAIEIGPEEFNSLPEQENLFMYAIQTKDQRQLMLAGCQHILVVDETHGTNQYSYQLLTMLVVDEKRYGWPIAHCITSHSSEVVLQYFFQAVKSKCPNLVINCVITDDDPKLINAMEFGFKEKLRHLLCKWHLGMTFKKRLREKAPSDLREDMYLGLKLMVDTRNSSDFQRLYDGFLNKYLENGAEFIDYFNKYYYTPERIPKWASCHRKFPHMSVDTTGHVESFHRRLKCDYFQRIPNKRIDALVQILLDIAEDDYWRRRKSNFFGLSSEDSCSVSASHKKSLNIPDASISCMFDNIWDVKSCSSLDVSYEVTKVRDSCDDDHCMFKCSSDICRDLCSHLYFCSCLDVNPLCKHIHKLHSFLNRRKIRCDQEEEQINPVFFSQPLEISSATEIQPGSRFVEIRRKRLIENLKSLLQKAEDYSLDPHILIKTDADIEKVAKNVEACSSSDVSGIPNMVPSTSFTSREKLKTQESQLLPFKRMKRKRKPDDPVLLAFRRSVVQEELLSHSQQLEDDDDDDDADDDIA